MSSRVLTPGTAERSYAEPVGPATDAGTDGDFEPRRGTSAASTVPTMLDIARVAGVSQSTVSRVLNDQDTKVRIGAKTRERVKATARELGYRPNPIARALRGAPTMLLGVIVRDFGDPFFTSAIDVLATEAMGIGYNLILGHAHGRLAATTRLASLLETRHTDAIVMLGDIHDQPQLIADLKAAAVPVVATWQGVSQLDFPTVDIDDAAGMCLGLQHLADLGHTRIALASAQLPLLNPQREEVYLEFMRERFGGVPEGYVQHVPNSLEGGEAALAALVALPEVPTAVAATTDLVAVGILHGAWTLGSAVPGALSVIGYDDLNIAAHTVPPLTTVRMPIVEIIREALQTALVLARDPAASRGPRVVRFPPTLVVRQSTSPPVAR